jgi:hypothetical protein
MNVGAMRLTTAQGSFFAFPLYVTSRNTCTHSYTVTEIVRQHWKKLRDVLELRLFQLE